MKTAVRIIISLLVVVTVAIIPYKAYAQDSSILDGYIPAVPE